MSYSLSRTSLIGYTGFIGSTLSSQFDFTHCFNRENIHSLSDSSYNLSICCAAPGLKWYANKYPDSDLSSINSLIQSLSSLRTDHFVLISTIDVGGHGAVFNEDHQFSYGSLQEPYGLHRLKLEQFAATHFSRCTIIRLPALVGPGLRKNFIYDLAHGIPVSSMNFKSMIQLYPIHRLFSDILRSLSYNIKVLHLSSPPFSIQSVFDQFPEYPLFDSPNATPFCYDMQTIYGSIYHTDNNYSVSLAEAFSALELYLSLNS